MTRRQQCAARRARCTKGLARSGAGQSMHGVICTERGPHGRMAQMARRFTACVHPCFLDAGSTEHLRHAQFQLTLQRHACRILCIHRLPLRPASTCAARVRALCVCARSKRAVCSNLLNRNWQCPARRPCTLVLLGRRARRFGARWPARRWMRTGAAAATQTHAPLWRT